MSKPTQYLLDVNVLLALTLVEHEHYQTAHQWFKNSPDLQWAMCAFTEAGLIRNLTRTRPGQLEMEEATSVLETFEKHSGYHYISIDSNWETLCGPFFKRLFGHNQVTDAYLLGLAVHKGLVLATLDAGIVHLAGNEFSNYVLLLGDQ